MTAKKKAAPKKKAAKKRARAKQKYHKKVISKKLTPKQELFIADYLANGFNATKAAIAAGYAKRNADTQGSRLLATPLIRSTIDAKKQEMVVSREITAERTLDEIAKVAFLDPRRLWSRDGEGLIPIGELDDGTAAAIAGIEVTELKQNGFTIGRLKKIKIADKLGALALLGRYLKLFTDKVEHSGSLGVQLVTTVPRPQRKALPKKKET